MPGLQCHWYREELGIARQFLYLGNKSEHTLSVKSEWILLPRTSHFSSSKQGTHTRITDVYQLLQRTCLRLWLSFTPCCLPTQRWVHLNPEYPKSAVQHQAADPESPSTECKPFVPSLLIHLQPTAIDQPLKLPSKDSLSVSANSPHMYSHMSRLNSEYTPEVDLCSIFKCKQLPTCK